MCQYHCVLPLNHPGNRTKASLNNSGFIHVIHDSNNWDAEVASIVQCESVHLPPMWPRFNSSLGPVFGKPWKFFRPVKPFCTIRTSVILRI